MQIVESKTIQFKLRHSELILQNPSFVTDFFCNFAAKSKNSLPIMTLYPKLIMDALATVTYAGTKKNLVDSNMVVDTPAINGQTVKVVLEFPRDTDPFLKSTVKAAEAAIKYHCGKDVEVEIITEFKSKPRPAVEKLLPDVKNIIAVSSGKGGVGKSTVAANLAIALVGWVIKSVCWTVTFSVLRNLKCFRWRMRVPML